MLRAFLGINAAGETRLYVSPFALNEVSPMHMRGTPFPESVAEIKEGGVEQPLVALNDLQNYFDRHQQKKRK